MKTKTKREDRLKRHRRVRAVIKGTSERPRLSVFRSGNHIYAQLIDDANEITLLSASSHTITSEGLKTKKSRSDNRSFGVGAGDLKEVKSKKSLAGKKANAFKVGEILAREAKDKGIKAVIFDRGGYKYHGRVKALAEGARKGGLSF